MHPLIGTLLAAAVCLGHATVYWPEVWTCDGACGHFRTDDRVEVYRCPHGSCPTQPCSDVTPSQLCPSPNLNPWTPVGTVHVQFDEDGHPIHVSDWPYLKAPITPVSGRLYDYALVVFNAAGTLLARSVIYTCEAGPVLCFENGGSIPCR